MSAAYISPAWVIVKDFTGRLFKTPCGELTSYHCIGGCCGGSSYPFDGESLIVRRWPLA
ncbi:MAG: hypothetical protein Q9M30_03245 [Mariprofundaceae bacterium]|nr:hypothetical protein [Mariprofundaceae bacterium]